MMRFLSLFALVLISVSLAVCAADDADAGVEVHVVETVETDERSPGARFDASDSSNDDENVQYDEDEEASDLDDDEDGQLGFLDVNSGDSATDSASVAAGRLPESFSSTAHLAWKRTRGPRMHSISALDANRVLGISRYGRIVSFSTKTNRWSRFEPLAPRRRAVTWSCRGEVFAVTTQGEVIHKVTVSADWKPMVNKTEVVAKGMAIPPPFVRIAAGAGEGDVFALAAGGRLFRFNVAKKNFLEIPGKLRSISIGCEADTTGAVYAVSRGNSLYRLINLSSSNPSENRWSRVAGGVSYVAAGKNVIVLDTRGRAYHFRTGGSGGKKSGTAGGRKASPLFIRLSSVASSRDGVVIGIKHGRAYRQVIDDAFRRSLGMESAAVLKRAQGGTWNTVPGSQGITFVATGGASLVVGVTREGAVKKRSGSSSSRSASWEDLGAPEAMQKIAITCDGRTLMGISKNLNTFKLDLSAPAPSGKYRWTRIYETLTDISAGRDQGQIWGTNAERKLVVFNDKDGKFAIYNTGSSATRHSSFRSVSAGCDSAVWAANTRGRVFSLASSESSKSSWTRRARGVRQVSHGRTTYVLGRRGMLYKFVPNRSSAHRARLGFKGRRGLASASLKPMRKRLRQVASNADGEVYGIDMHWRLVSFKPTGRSRAGGTSAGWRELGAKLDDVCVGSRKHIYALQRGTVMSWNDAHSVFSVVPAPPLTRIHCSCDGVVWGSNFRSGSVYRLRDKKVGWERVANSRHIARVAVAKKGVAYGVDRRGRLVKWSDKENDWLPYKEDDGIDDSANTGATDLAESANGNHGNPVITSVPPRLRSVSAGCEGELAVLSRSGAIWQRDIGASGSSETWVRIGTGARRISIGGGKAYAIGKRGDLFSARIRSDATTSNKKTRFRLMGRLSRVSAGADGSVWGIDKLKNGWMVHHEVRASLPVVPRLKVKSIHATPEGAKQPDGAAIDPFRAGSDPVAVALKKIDSQMSLSDVEKMANEVGKDEASEAAVVDKFPEAPQPSLAPEARQGDYIEPYDRLKKSELVDFVNIDSE